MFTKVSTTTVLKINHRLVSIGIIALQYISPNCHYILSHISQSHGGPKTIFATLEGKDPNSIYKKAKQK